MLARKVLSLLDQALVKENQLLSVKDEDSSLKAGISSLGNNN